MGGILLQKRHGTFESHLSAVFNYLFFKPVCSIDFVYISSLFYSFFYSLIFGFFYFVLIYPAWPSEADGGLQ